MAKLKYDYDINIVIAMENQGFSLRQIALKNNWPISGLRQWLGRHYIKKTTYYEKVKIKLLKDRS